MYNVKIVALIVVTRAELKTIIAWASLTRAIRLGRPNFSIAYSALKKGINPPKVVAAATKSVGTCRMERFLNIMIA